jgi:hypothetical protein
VQQAGVGGPCKQGEEKRTVEKSQTFFVLDESRQVTIEDLSIRPERIDPETRSGIRSFFGWVAGLIGIGSKSGMKVPGTGVTTPGPGLPTAARIALSYGQLIALGAAKVLSDLEKALQKAKRPGGLSDYYFVRVTIPRDEITVTCTCTVECRNGVWTCTGCTPRETQKPGDSVEDSEGTRAEVEQFIAGMQARAKAAKEALATKEAFANRCGCG